MGRTAGTNIRIVAKAAGVSPATASRALNGNTSVNAELTQRAQEEKHCVHHAGREQHLLLKNPDRCIRRHTASWIPGPDHALLL